MGVDILQMGTMCKGFAQSLDFEFLDSICGGKPLLPAQFGEGEEFCHPAQV